MQNMRIGVVVSSVPVGVKLSNFDPCPDWNTHTMAPNVAVSESKLSTTALVGTSRLPNMRNKVMNVTSATIPSAHGTLAKMAALESTSWAADPVTSTGHGGGTARTRCTRCSPAGDCGCSDATGTTESHVPVGLAKRADAAEAGATRAPFTYDPVAASTRATDGTRDSADAYDVTAVAPPPRAATTDRALDSPDVKSDRSTSAATRVLADVGSTRSSGWPQCTPRNGEPSRTRKAVIASAIGSGRRITAVASRC